MRRVNVVCIVFTSTVITRLSLHINWSEDIPFESEFWFVAQFFMWHLCIRSLNDLSEENQFAANKNFMKRKFHIKFMNSAYMSAVSKRRRQRHFDGVIDTCEWKFFRVFFSVGNQNSHSSTLNFCVDAHFPDKLNEIFGLRFGRFH